MFRLCSVLFIMTFIVLTTFDVLRCFCLYRKNENRTIGTNESDKVSIK